jgi:hypothetical protein
MTESFDNSAHMVALRHEQQLQRLSCRDVEVPSFVHTDRAAGAYQAMISTMAEPRWNV